MNWQSLVESLGGTLIIVGGVAWLAREIIKYYLSKNISSFENSLKAKSEAEIEEFNKSGTDHGFVKFQSD